LGAYEVESLEARRLAVGEERAQAAVVQGLPEGQERGAGFEQAGASQHPRALRAGRKLVQKARLADAGLAGNDHGAPGPGAGGLQALAQQAKLRLASYKPSRRQRHDGAIMEFWL
jgi:hypothetical protein